MSNQERRKSKRIAALYDEQDGDFKFARASKRAKTTPAIEEEPPKPAPRTRRSAARTTVEDELAEPRRRSGRRRRASAEPEEPPEVAPKRTTRQKAGAEAEEVPEVRPKRTTRRKASVEPEEAPEATPKRTTRRKASTEPEEASEVVPRRTTRRKASAGPEEAPEAAPKRTRRGNARKQSSEPKANGAPPREEPRADATPVAPPPPPSTEPESAERVALPMSDTPVINRNKEMRKKGATASRRSSLGSRGRRASSLIEMGHTALPHREVGTGEFYKHVEEGLPEPRRMRQILTWCGERALSEKPGLGSEDSAAILGARAIQDQLLKDFQEKSEFSNWFDREDSAPAAVAKQPNPRNIEHERKIQQLEEKIKRLREQKKMWQSLKRIRLNPEPLFPDDADPSRPPPPNEALLDPAEQKILSSLTSQDTSFAAIHARTASRLKAVQATLGQRVDVFADNVHKLEQRVATAGREADRVLGLGAVRLREREEREKTAAGTREVPVMEVIRSLGRILPEGDG